MGDWAELGNMSAACITRMDCTDGGTLMVWIKRLSGKYGGYLATVSKLGTETYSSGLRITGER